MGMACFYPFSQNSQPSFDQAFEHRQPIQLSQVPSAASGGVKMSGKPKGEKMKFQRRNGSIEALG